MHLRWVADHNKKFVSIKTVEYKTMSSELITFFSFFLGVSSVVLGLLIIYLARRTDKLIKSEDARAKRLIEEGNKRTQLML